MIAEKVALLAVTAWLCSSPVLSRAEPGHWSSHLTCRDQVAVGYAIPETLAPDALLRDLVKGALPKTETEVELPCAFFGKQWSAQKTPTLVVFLETAEYHRTADGTPVEGIRRLRIGVFQQESQGQYRLLARSSKGFDIRLNGRLSALDFAAYKLTPDSFAFGVRTEVNFECPSNCSGMNEYLDLYRADGGEIRPVLSSLMWSRTDTTEPVGDDLSRSRDHTYEGDQDSAQISILTTRTKGVFDWKKRKGKRSATLKWNGETHELQADDPVTDLSISAPGTR
jgi:hypothetical protein